MANRIEQARAAVDACIREAYLRAAAAGDLPEGADVRGSVEQPKDTANGDYTTTFCLAAAKAMQDRRGAHRAHGVGRHVVCLR